jgi:hypothetical protein
MEVFFPITCGDYSKRFLRDSEGNLLLNLILSKFICQLEWDISTVKINDRIDNIPRWSGLNHFSSLLKNSEFSDSSKYEDMGKASSLNI